MTTKLKILSRLGHGTNDMYWFILPAVLPLILLEYGFSYATAGAFLTSFLCVTALFSFILGKLADFLPRRLLLGSGFLLASGALFAAGLVPGFPAFMLLLLLAAVGVSSYHPVIYAAIDEATVERRGRMFAAFELSGALGVITLFLLQGVTLALIGWKGVVMAVAAPGFVMGTLFLRNRGSVNGAPERTGPVSTVPERPTATRALVVVFFVSIVLRTLSTTAVMNFMPTFLVHSTGLGEATGSYMAVFIFFGAASANLFTGILADSRGPIVMLIGSSLLFGFFLVVSTYVQAAWMLPLMLMLLGAGMSAAIPAQNLLLSSFSDPDKRGAAFGMLMGIMTIANSVGPLFLGIIADRIGLALTFRLAAIPVLISGAIVVAIGRARKRAAVG